MSGEVGFIGDGPDFDAVGPGPDHQKNEKYPELSDVANKIAAINDPTRYTLDLAGAITDAVAIGTTSEKTAHSCEKVAEVFGKILGFLGIVSLIGHIKWWLCKPMKDISSSELVARVSFLGYRLLAIPLLLEKMRAFSLSAATIGKIPILNVISGGLISVLGLFFAINAFQTYRKVERHQDKLEEKLYEAKAALRNAIPIHTEQNEKYIQGLTNRVKKIEDAIEGNEIVLTKTRIELFNCLFSLVIGALIIISLTNPVGFLAMSGAFMITLGVVSAVAVLGELVYSEWIHGNVELTTAEQIGLLADIPIPQEEVKLHKYNLDEDPEMSKVRDAFLSSSPNVDTESELPDLTVKPEHLPVRSPKETRVE